MFGQNNQQPNDQIPDHSIQGALQSDDAAAQAQTPSAPPIMQPVSDSQSAWGHPGVPLDGNQEAAPVTPPTNTSPPLQLSDDQPADDQQPPATDQPHPDQQGTNALISIKQQALTQLSPLVGHLDQSPEEKFRTTMMMIQASDDQSLVPVAYEAANAIQDEKAKAQALLDIVNEINYFTQHHQG